MPVYLKIIVCEHCTFPGFRGIATYVRPLHHVRHETYFSRSQIMDGNCRYCWKLSVNTKLISCHFRHTVTNLLELSGVQQNNARCCITGGHDQLKNSRP